VPPTGDVTVTTNRQRPACGERANASSPCVRVALPVFGSTYTDVDDPSSVPSGSISQPITSVPALSGHASETCRLSRCLGTLNSNVSVWATNCRPLPPSSVPSNDPPRPLTGTSERRTTGTTVWSPELSDTTRSWALSPAADGIVVRNSNLPVSPGRSVRLDGLTLSTPWNL